LIKSELIKRIATRRPLFLERQVEKVLNIVRNEIADALVRGDRVELRGFGVFSLHQYHARTARNPRTGALVSVGPRRRPAFKVGR
jgi:integration host factor subunit beta